VLGVLRDREVGSVGDTSLPVTGKLDPFVVLGVLLLPCCRKGLDWIKLRVPSIRTSRAGSKGPARHGCPQAH
jgi:hypothetical protein